ncbi:hypothetical protein KBD45_07705 [Candidatus Dojkabacteria bacterium]|nr:hypothetical protein [Candidatus Dojkabacteria bacterium]
MRLNLKHFPHYFSLVSIFAFGLIGFYLFPYDKDFLMALTYALSAAYLSWGIIHHYIHEELYLSILLEYLAVAILGCVLVVSLIYRS